LVDTRLQTALHETTQRNLELERQLAAATAADAVRQQMTAELMRRLDTLSAGSGSKKSL
jgi:hypothetical protein